MINLLDVQKLVMENEKKEILEKHAYKIWKGSNGKWYTYLPDEEKGRILKKRNSETDLESMVYEFYKNKSEKKKLTFSDVFNLYKNFQETEVGVSLNTIVKYEYDYKRYFEDTEFSKSPIESINSEHIRAFIIRTTKEKELLKKALKSFYGYINSVFFFAFANKIITENPMSYVTAKIFYKYCSEPLIDIRKKIISDEQMSALNDQFNADFVRKPNYIPTYAVKMASLTGMRTGELAALTWDCIFDEYILINKSEKYNRKENNYYISKTKNGKERFFPMTDEIKKLLKRIYEVKRVFGYNSEFVFSNENGRIHGRTITDCARNKSIQIGIDVKCITSYRRTVNSNLKSMGVPTIIASSMLGHTEEVNEGNYSFDISSLKEKQRYVEVINKKIANL